MTQKEKFLLLQDLCARLPYGVIIQVKDWTYLDTELKIGHISRLKNEDIELKPYLRPLSSMTEEENNGFQQLDTECDKMPTFDYVSIEHYRVFDWLNAHHFDYRGLIEKGLALEAPVDMYKID